LCAALGISLILSASQDELVRDGYHGSTPNVQKNMGDTTTTTVYNGDDEDDEDYEDDEAVCDVFDATTSKVNSKFPPHQNKEAFFYSINSQEADPLILRLMNLTRAVEQEVAKNVPNFASPMNATGKFSKVAAWSEYASKLKHPYALLLLHLYEALRLLVVTWSAAIDLAVEYLLMTIASKVEYPQIAPALQVTLLWKEFFLIIYCICRLLLLMQANPHTTSDFYVYKIHS
jgi:hypothetical protein